jgi:tripartite-type tricarboxylate transporter receptor subunit TctC
MNFLRRKTLALGGAFFGLALSNQTAAQSFPDRPIKIIISVPPGGSVDLWARIVTAKLEKLLGQPIVSDYRPGGGTAIGAEAAARAPADGYTIHQMGSAAYAFIPNMRKVPYDPLSSFVPLGALGSASMVLVVNPKVPARNIAELVAYSKANPGKLNCANSGLGSSNHLAAELLKMRTGIQFVNVPYKGGANYLSDLSGGVVDLAFTTPVVSIPFLQTGKWRAIGVASANRSALIPSVPTISEQGVPGFDVRSWVLFVGPAGIPAEPLARLRTAFRTSLENPEVVTALQNAGMEDVGSVPVDKVAELIRSELNKWGEVIRNAQITVGN